MESVLFHPSGSSAPSFVPDPAHGRVFTVARAIRSSEVTAAGRLRLDALARYLQDAAEDDLADSGWGEPYDWLVRRVSVAIGGYPARGDPLSLRTFCSATGPRWAERTTTVSRSGTDLMQAVAVWAAVGREDGRPVPLGPEFYRRYGDATGGRTVSARLSLPGPPRPGPPGRQAGRGRCGPATSTPRATLITLLPGPRPRTSWPGSTGCPPAANWSTGARSCPVTTSG